MAVTSMRTHALAASAILAVLGMPMATLADTAADEAYRAQLTRAHEEHRADAERCRRAPQDAQALCVVQAQARLEREQARARATFEDTPHARMQARVDIAEADYRLALAQCDRGSDRDMCRADARVVRARAIEQAKLDYAHGPHHDAPAVDAYDTPSTTATPALGTHECAAVLDLDERYRCIRRAEQAGRM